MDTTQLLSRLQTKPTSDELRQFHAEQQCALCFAKLPRAIRVFIADLRATPAATASDDDEFGLS